MTELFGASTARLSTAYRCQQTSSCLRLLRQARVRALSLALARTGKSKAARMAMIAMTTNNSIKVNALEPFTIAEALISALASAPMGFMIQYCYALIHRNHSRCAERVCCDSLRRRKAPGQVTGCTLGIAGSALKFMRSMASRLQPVRNSGRSEERRV